MMTVVRKSKRSGRARLVVALAAWLLPGISALGQQPAPPSKVAASTSRSAPRATSLEEFLSRALRTHPEILAAEAKVELAKAELSQTRFQITRELITLWNERQAQSENVKTLEKLATRGVTGTRDLIEAKGKLAEIETQLSYLLGRMGAPPTAAPGAGGPKRLPEGPHVAKIAAVLDTAAVLEFIDTPLCDVADVLADYHKVVFIVDTTVRDVPVTIDVKGALLGAGLQAIEDITPGIRFVVCDYGILVTPEGSPAAATYISANEFWRQQQQKALESETFTSSRRRMFEAMRKQQDKAFGTGTTTPPAPDKGISRPEPDSSSTTRKREPKRFSPGGPFGGRPKPAETKEPSSGARP